ncbi:hypothetical protein Tco_0558603 [Tanacetum coccineum]
MNNEHSMPISKKKALSIKHPLLELLNRTALSKDGTVLLLRLLETMLSASKLPLSFWLSYGENLDKMKEKGDPCVMVGYSTQSKGYRVYNKRTRLIVESIHIKFDEIKEMMSDHNSSDLAPQRQEMSVENVSSGLVPQGQKASDYDNSDPVPPRQNVVPTAERTDSSQQGLKDNNFSIGPILGGDHKVVRLGINPMIQPEQEDLPKDNPKLEIAVLRRMKKKCMDKGSKERSPPHNLRQKPDADAPPPPPPLPQSQTLVVAQAPHTMSTIKLPILKKGEYDVWAMKMEHYLAHTDYPLWEFVQKGNGPVNVSTDTHGIMKVLPPKTAEETLARERERKARTTLLLALPEDHLAKFHKMTDAKEMWEAIKSRFGGNEESKKNKAKDNSKRLGKKEESNALMTLDGGCVDWTSHLENEQDNYAFMACNSSCSDTNVTSCSKECKESYVKLKKLYDEQREQLGDDNIEIHAYTQALKKVEAQLVAHQQGQLWYEEKIRFMKIELDDKTDVLTYHKKLLAEAEKEKEDLKAKVEKWHNSSKNLNILLNSQMSARDKAGLGYGDQLNKGVLSYENEVFQSVFVSRTSETENSPVNDRYAEGMHAVPPPMTGIYIPSGPDKEIDDSQFTYGPKQSKPSESDARSSDFNSCESNCSEETHESMPEPVVNEPKVVSEPKVWSDAPIIEEYESDSEDEHVSLPTKEQEIPSFAFINTDKHVKTPRQTVKEQNTCSQSPKPDKKDCSGLMSKKLGLGFGYTKKACFVCGSFSHLIRDCDFHEKRMAKQAELNNRMSKGSSQREIRPVWNNVQRMNHQNQFVPKAVLTRTGKIPVNTARTSGTNTVNTARHNFNRQAVPINAARKVNTVKPIVNNARPKAGFHKSVSPFRKSFNRTTTLRTNFSKQKVNTAEVNAVSAVKGKRETVVKPSAGCNWRPKRHYWHKDYPQRTLQNKGIVDSGCSRHMTGNKAYLAEYQDFNGGPVAFGGSKGYITGKGKIKIGKLDFEDVCFVKELQHFNLFSVSQMCDKKNKDYFCTANFGLLILFSTVKSTKAKNTGEEPNKHHDLKPIDKEDQVFLDELERLKRQEQDANDTAEALRKEFTQETEDLLIQAGAA